MKSFIEFTHGKAKVFKYGGNWGVVLGQGFNSFTKHAPVLEWFNSFKDAIGFVRRSA